MKLTISAAISCCIGFVIFFLFYRTVFCSVLLGYMRLLVSKRLKM